MAMAWSRGDDASGSSKQACNFASDERDESILALLSPHRHFTSLFCFTVGEKFENAQ
jgi:hypothetical protein